MMAAIRATAASGGRMLMPSGIETSAEAAIRLSSVATMRRPEPTEVLSIATANGPSTSNGSAAATGGIERTIGPSRRDLDPPAGPGAIDRRPAAPPRTPPRTAPMRSPAPATSPAGSPTSAASSRRGHEKVRRRRSPRSARRSAPTTSTSTRRRRSRTRGPCARRKEAAQDAFRVARAASQTRDDLEAAAREWLTEINRINLVTREAIAQAERHRLAAAELAVNLERLSVEADAARISAESAEEACIAAREARGGVPGGRHDPARRAVDGAVPRRSRRRVARCRVGESPDEDPSMASRAGEDAVIIRLLRGDRESMNRLVARLGGDDVGRAAPLAAVDRRPAGGLRGPLDRGLGLRLPDRPPVLGSVHETAVPRHRGRPVVARLSARRLRRRGRTSTCRRQRDLTLAVGYAGLDPMRIRHWPSEPEMRDLLKEVTVAADEYIWEAAGALTLGELVSLLGRRADGLTELWNEWGVVRPLLLSAE